jgi:hypothetical protein
VSSFSRNPLSLGGVQRLGNIKMAADDADEVNKNEDKRAEREAFWSNQDKTAARDAKSAAKQKEQSQKVRLADRDERLKVCIIREMFTIII